MTPRVPGRERPILFSGPMVRAILEGRKTQTRRVYVPRKGFPREGGDTLNQERWIDWGPCPYGQPGDRLWVRETFWDHDFDQGDPTTKLSPERLAERVEYRADEWERKGDGDAGGWKPSIHMPRWASRLTLEITEVRVERVQEIEPSEVYSEGVHFIPPADPLRAFIDLWDSLNKSRGYGWDKNPWVWVISFKAASRSAQGERQ